MSDRLVVADFEGEVRAVLGWLDAAQSCDCAPEYVEEARQGVKRLQAMIREAGIGAESDG